MNSNVRSTAVLGADRAVRQEDEEGGAPVANVGDFGNHMDGWNVVKVDTSVEFLSTGSDVNGAGMLPGDIHLLGV